MEDLNWIVAGDLNLIKELSEEKGGLRILDQMLVAFKETIKGMGLEDLEFVNGCFTWNNQRGVSHQIASNLEQCLVLDFLMLLGQSIEASILPFAGFDH